MHTRARILEALSESLDAIDVIESVTLGAANLKKPVRGVTLDISLDEEDSDRTVGDKPNEGMLQRVLDVELILSSLSSDRTAIEFEDQVMAPVEVAITTCEALAPFADDWRVVKTKWNYAQDTVAGIIASLIIVRIFYSTHPAQPAMAL